MRISDWSSDVCSSDLVARASQGAYAQPGQVRLGYAARAEGRSGGRRRLLRPSLALLGQAGTPASGHGQSLRHEPSRRSEEHTSELQSLMRISYAVFCLKKKKKKTQ